MEHGGRRGRRRAVQAAGVLIGLAISAVFGYFAVRGVNFDAAWRALGATNYWWIGPSVAALAASVFLKVVRWQVLFRPTVARCRIR